MKEPTKKPERLNHQDPANARQIWQIMQSAYTVEAALIGADDFPPLRRMESEVQSADSHFYGIYENGELAAIIELEFLSEDSLLIAGLAVDPGHFRRGLGRRLVQYARRRAAGRRLTVSTAASNEPAIRLYEKVGFVITDHQQTPEGITLVKLALEQE